MKNLAFLVFCLSFPTFSFSELQKHASSFTDTCLEPEASPETIEIFEKCENYSFSKVDLLVKELKIIHDIFEFKHVDMVMIIADKKKDAVNLARFLTLDHKLLPLKNRSDFKEDEKETYDLIVENVHLYKHPNKSTIFFPYPRKRNFESYISQIVLLLMHSVSTWKIIFTLPAPVRNLGLDIFNIQKEREIIFLFELTPRIFRSITKYRNSSLLVITNGELSNKDFYAPKPRVQFSEEEKNSYREIIATYGRHFRIGSNQRELSEYVTGENLIFLDGWNPMEYYKVLTHLDKLNSSRITVFDFHNNIHVVVDCWYNLINVGLIHSFNSLPMALDSELSKTKGTNLNYFFDLQKKTETIYNSVSSFLNCMLSNDVVVFNHCMKNLNSELSSLTNPNIDKFTLRGYNYIKSLCMVHFWFTKEFLNLEHINQAENWTRQLVKYEKILKKKNDWIKKLKVTYDQVDFLSEEETSSSFRELLEELESNENAFGNTTLMKDVYDAVKSNAFKIRATFSCVELQDVMKLTVRGKFLKLSQIIMNKSYWSKDYRILEIFALYKVLIDVDIVAVGKEITIAIFSPVWEVVSDRIINLDGASRNLTLEDYLEPKASNGNNDLNQNGADGQAGLSGGAAGSFYGLAQTIINAENLRFSLNGGNGSNGQDGGDGADGQNGISPDNDDIDLNLRKRSCDWYSFFRLNFKVIPSEEKVTYLSVLGDLLNFRYRKECYIFGLRGFSGGNGGNGGVRGKGGIAGEFKLLSLNGSIVFPVTVMSSNGADGKEGFGGKAGKGGSSRKITMRNFDYYKFGVVSNETIVSGADGKNGKDGVSFLGSEIPRKETILQSFAHLVNRYKKFVFSSIVGQDSNYVELYNQLISNKQIFQTHNMLTLVDELGGMEEEYHLMKNKTHALFLYQTWKEGILDYFMHRRQTDKTNEYSTVLRSLDNMVSLKIRRIKNSNDLVVFLLSTYLVEFQKQLKCLQDSRQVLSTKYASARFSNDINQNVDKAQRIIQVIIQKEVDLNTRRLEGETELIFKKMEAVIEMNKNPESEIGQVSGSLEGRLESKTFNDILAMINLGLGLINPSLIIIGAKFSEASSKLEKLIDDSADRDVVDVEVCNSTEGYRQYFQNQVALRKGIQESVLDKALELAKQKVRQLLETREDSKPLDGIVALITKLVNMTSVDKLTKSDLVKVLDYELDNPKSLWSNSNECNQSVCAETHWNGAFLAINRLKTCVRMMVMVGHHFLDLNETKKLDHFEIEINRVFEKTSTLRTLQEEVYTKLAPLMEKMWRSPKSFSTVTYLDLKSFEMQKFFNYILNRLENCITKSPVLKSFVGVMRDLREAIDLVLGSFSKLQNHVETLKKIPYVRDLHLPPFDITYVKDSQLSMHLTKTIQLSYANYVLDDYHKWMASFKQHIFPFTNQFTNVFVLPDKISEDFVIMAERAGERLESYGMQLHEKSYKLVASRRLNFAEFGQELSPFYVWDSTRYSAEIKRILSGQRVTLFANISEHRELNAVKFSNVWLRISSADPEVKKDDINGDLQSFSVKLSHNGDSYYRCDERRFVMSSKSYVLETMYNDGNCKMNSSNGISLEKYVLSPYATWTIELVSRDDNKNNEALLKYESKVNIELVGLGLYSPPNMEECKDELLEYRDFEILD